MEILKVKPTYLICIMSIIGKIQVLFNLRFNEELNDRDRKFEDEDDNHIDPYKIKFRNTIQGRGVEDALNVIKNFWVKL